MLPERLTSILNKLARQSFNSLNIYLVLYSVPVCSLYLTYLTVSNSVAINPHPLINSYWCWIPFWRGRVSLMNWTLRSDSRTGVSGGTQS